MKNTMATHPKTRLFRDFGHLLLRYSIEMLLAQRSAGFFILFKRSFMLTYALPQLGQLINNGSMMTPSYYAIIIGHDTLRFAMYGSSSDFRARFKSRIAAMTSR